MPRGGRAFSRLWRSTSASKRQHRRLAQPEPKHRRRWSFSSSKRDQSTEREHSFSLLLQLSHSHPSLFLSFSVISMDPSMESSPKALERENPSPINVTNCVSSSNINCLQNPHEPIPRFADSNPYLCPNAHRLIGEHQAVVNLQI